MFITTTIGLSIAPPSIYNFRWGWDSNPWVPLKWHYLLPQHGKKLRMFILRLTKPLYSLRGFIIFTNRSVRFCRNPMQSTSSATINIGYHTSFRWETRFGYICRKITLQGPIGRFTHFIMGITQSPRLWVAMLLISTLHPSLACTQCSMWTSFGHIFHPY
jgi:hypothetical protein